MVYYVIELQTDSSGAGIVSAFTDRAVAEARYHNILAVAAESAVNKHGAMLCNEDMHILKSEVYVHEQVEAQE